ncbi:MAG: hypothetical protein D3904_08190 [Candidatus Electrothrix sp. EH2]|nr:hypothetical protein [Candidatus Electrothrix sp. EH2]
MKNRYLATARYDAGWQRLNDFVLGNRWAPFVSVRTETGTLLAAARGVEYRWPLLDHRLIQHFLATPTVEKYSRGIGRYLHKRAVDDLLPHKVAWKQGKDMGDRIARQDKTDLATQPDVAVPENGPLHPLLVELVDGEKVAEHRHRLDSELSDGHNMALTPVRRTLSALSQLDLWLKEYT